MKNEKTLDAYKIQAVTLCALRDLTLNLATDPELQAAFPENEHAAPLTEIAKSVDSLRCRLMDLCKTAEPEKLEELGGRSAWEVYQPDNWEAGEKEKQLVFSLLAECKKIGRSKSYAVSADLTPAQKAGATNQLHHQQRKDREKMKKTIARELEKMIADDTCDKATKEHAAFLLAAAYRNGVRA